MTTRNADGTANISPMGPIVDEQMRQFTLRPFTTSQTYRNLKLHSTGVLHVTDDVLLIAQAAIGKLTENPPMSCVDSVGGFAIDNACRWYAFRVKEFDDANERTTIRCEVVQTCRVRDFFGFNRAKHAVIEAAILATRIGLISIEQIDFQYEHLEIIVGKTGGKSEIAAFEMLQEFVNRSKQHD